MTATSMPFCTTRYLSCSYSSRPGLVIADASVSEASGEILQYEPSDPSDWSYPAACPQNARMREWRIGGISYGIGDCLLYEIRHAGKESREESARVVLVIFSLETKVPKVFYLLYLT